MVLSAYVIAQNEEEVIGRCLDSLCALADEVVVVDSESTDRTREIAESYPKVRWHERPMPFTFADQRNFAHSLCVGEWVLTLDADEVFHPHFARVLPSLLEDDRYQAYSFPRLGLFGDETHYIDKPALIPGDWDTQIRLYRRDLEWGHDGPGGLHESLVIEGEFAQSHPAHVTPGVRYIHYPILHYQLLKSESALRAKAPSFLKRQAPGGRFEVTDVDWWVRSKSVDYPLLRVEDWECWMSFPPETDDARIGWIHDRERRIEELIDYTGLSRGEIHRRMTRAETWRTLAAFDLRDEPLRSWEGHIFGLAAWHLDAPARRRLVASVAVALKGAKDVLVYGDGVGDVSMELALRGVRGVVYSEPSGPLSRFFEWRRHRFGLDGRIGSSTSGSGQDLEGRFDAIVGLGLTARLPDPVGALRDLAGHTDRLVLDPDWGVGDPLRIGDDPDELYPVVPVLSRLGWRSGDGLVWERRHHFRVRRRPPAPGKKRILASLMHPPWIYNFARLGHEIEVLPTPAWGAWCDWVRPLPENMRMLPLDLWKAHPEARFAELTVPPFRPSDWDFALIQHELDIPVMIQGDIPLVFMAHSFPSTREVVDLVAAHRSKIRAGVFTSPRKRDAWGWEKDGLALAPAIDTPDFHGYTGEITQCLVVCNSFTGTDGGRAIERLDRVTRGLSVFLCDPAIMTHADCDFARIKSYYRTRRVYVHVVQDRAIMSLMEAMCTGMPAVVLKSYSDGILDRFEDGVNCFISEDLDYLHRRTRQLLGDPDLCRRIGGAGRDLIRRYFDLGPWLTEWERVIHAAIG